MRLPRRPKVQLKSGSRPKPPAQRPTGAPLVVWFGLLAAAAVAYLPALRNGFTFDDRVVITDADYLLSHLSWVPKLFSSAYFALSGESTYRPTLTLTYMVDRTLGGGAAWMFHLQSVAWHVAVVALVFVLLRRMGAGVRAAGAIALLFAVHPALTEAVDNISFREDVLYTALGLAALVLFVGASAHSRTGRFLTASVILLLAQLAKETAFVFMALVPITLWCVSPPHPSPHRLRAFLRERRTPLIATAASGIAFVMLRFVLFKSGRGYGVYPGGSMWTGAATGVVALGHYVRLLFVPAPLCADYRGVIPPVTSLDDGRLWLGVALIAAIAYIALIARRTAPLVTWGIAMFFIGLLPVANLVPIPMPIAERFLYLPYIGALTALVVGVQHLHRIAVPRLPERTAAIALVVAVCILGVLTWRRHAVWKDNESLWTATLVDHPNAYGAMHGLAIVRLDQDRFDESEALLRRALASEVMDPNERAGMLDALGITYASAGKFETAVPVFTASLALGESAKTQYNLGVTLIQLSRQAEAELHLRRAIELNPFYAKPYALLIELARARGDVHEAERLERQRPEARQ